MQFLWMLYVNCNNKVVNLGQAAHFDSLNKWERPVSWDLDQFLVHMADSVTRRCLSLPMKQKKKRKSIVAWCHTGKVFPFTQRTNKTCHGSWTFPTPFSAFVSFRRLVHSSNWNSSQKHFQLFDVYCFPRAICGSSVQVGVIRQGWSRNEVDISIVFDLSECVQCCRLGNCSPEMSRTLTKKEAVKSDLPNVWKEPKIQNVVSYSKINKIVGCTRNVEDKLSAGCDSYSRCLY